MRELITQINKRLVLLIILLMLVGGYFWSQSRYPDLGRKAMMGEELQIEALGFDVLVATPPKASTARKIYVNSVNWMYTNRKGMAFGIVFGTILMTLMPFLVGLQFTSRFANTAVGVAIGAPLGLCVNCSTPIAHGMHEKGARAETMLATMISSPTLNVMVLTMLFSLFPRWLVLLKIGTTLIFIFGVIPLLARWFGATITSPAAIPRTSKSHWFSLDFGKGKDKSDSIICDNPLATETWAAAIRWIAINLGRNFLKLTKAMVPLMILAGVLGATLITLLPLDKLAGQLPDGRLFSWLSMGILALVGLILPSPMTFDVIISAVFFHGGMPVKYVVVLLFTLGIFSIYPFMTLWRNMSKQIAISIVGVLIVFAVGSGFVGDRYWNWKNNQKLIKIYEPFATSLDPPKIDELDRTQQGTSASELARKLKKDTLEGSSFFEKAGIEITHIPFSAPKTSQGEALMRRFDQREFGITEHENYSVRKLVMRYFVASRGLASGDVNRDGWQDFAIGSNVGIALYINKRGKTFEQQKIDISELNSLTIPIVSLVDIDNDGWLDLWLSSLMKGSYVIYSDHGDFVGKNLVRMKIENKESFAKSVAFGDLDRDGKLNIVIGNVSPNMRNPVMKVDSMQNFLLREGGEGFTENSLAGPGGDSFTSLLSDINQDGYLDFLIGNDFNQSDTIYFGDGQGGFDMVPDSDEIIPFTPKLTTSINSADLDNDLMPELFFAGAMPLIGTLPNSTATKWETSAHLCAELNDLQSKARCEEFYDFTLSVDRIANNRTVWLCEDFAKRSQRDACIAKSLNVIAVTQDDPTYCDLMPPTWNYFSFACKSNFTQSEPLQNGEGKAIPQKDPVNVLLRQKGDGVFENITKKRGIEQDGWTWNSKFADLDNDEWQDLFLVTGWSITHRTPESNLLFRNLEGKGFENITKKAGVESFLKTNSFTYLDIDNDGDLDIIVAPAVGPLIIYQNQTAGNQSIAFELHDEIGNFYGIGSKIIIKYGDGKHQVRELKTSGGYLSYDAPIAYFGLGKTDEIDEIEIQWSTGETTSIAKDFKAGSRYIITRIN